MDKDIVLIIQVILITARSNISLFEKVDIHVLVYNDPHADVKFPLVN